MLVIAHAADMRHKFGVDKEFLNSVRHIDGFMTEYVTAATQCYEKQFADRMWESGKLKEQLDGIKREKRRLEYQIVGLEDHRKRSTEVMSMLGKLRYCEGCERGFNVEISTPEDAAWSLHCWSCNMEMYPSGARKSS